MAAIRYRLRVPEPHTHLLHVELTVEGARGATELAMASWTPGSYLMREFARNVVSFAPEDGAGRPLPWAKTDKNTWRVEAGDGATLRVRYTVYANELSVRTSHVDASHAAVQGASAFFFVAGRQDEPAEVVVEAPPGWYTSTALPRVGGDDGAAEVFHAPDYDTLVDAPLEIGTHARFAVEVDGRPHRWAVWGRGNLDETRLLEDTRRIVLAQRELFGGLPSPDYLFILHLTPGGYGGLEHRDSTVLVMDRWAFRGKEYETFLGLTAHEYFHLWNGKRIRPAALGPFDYTRENYTRDLWVVEGFTTYYTDLVLRRAGVISCERYLERLGEAISRFQALPGRRVQTLADSSFDTWIRFYRPDPSTPNAQISYYQKGALVALLLDLRIRRATANARSLDDVMRLLWERFGEPDVGFPAGEVERVATEVAGEDLSTWFDAMLRGTDELDYDGELDAAGLRLVADEAVNGSSTGDGARPLPAAALVEARLGLRLRTEGGRVTVTHVLADTPGYRAGVNAGDELVAVDGLRVSAEGLAARIGERKPGDRVVLTVFRRDELVTLLVPLEVPRPSRWRVVPVAEPTTAQRSLLEDWLRVVV